MFFWYISCTQGIQETTKSSSETEVEPSPKKEKEGTHIPKNIQYDMKLIPAGKFTMGSKMDLSARHEDETPHKVTLTKDFWIGIYEITQENWFEITGDRPSFFQGCDTCPV